MISKPRRIKRMRTKGWRLPANCLYVGRPGKLGNPYKIGQLHPLTNQRMTAEEAVDLYKEWLDQRLEHNPTVYQDLIESLRGQDLACWCKLDQPCHADWLLEIANK